MSLSHIESPGISLLPPCSRRGYGPGLIVLTCSLETPPPHGNDAIVDGIPSPLVKWAEESYTVVHIDESALRSQPRRIFALAIDQFAEHEKCQPKGGYGLIVYSSTLWDLVAPELASFPEIVAGVVYGAFASSAPLLPVSIPLLQHVAIQPTAALAKGDSLKVYTYPNAPSDLFAVPFQKDFHSASEAVSHTRNLTFLKNHMKGPYFDLEAIWDEHTFYEFEDRSVERTMATMVREPYVNHVPTLAGGVGRDRLTSFYRDHFIFKNPSDTQLELISRTVGIDRVVDEFVCKFTHDVEVDWLIPGIPPTNRKLEIPFVAVVNIRGDRLCHEHITWDQGTVLKQLGLLPEYLPFPHVSDGKRFEVRVPVAGTEAAAKLRDKNAVASNAMFEYGMREV